MERARHAKLDVQQQDDVKSLSFILVLCLIKLLSSVTVIAIIRQTKDANFVRSTLWKKPTLIQIALSLWRSL